MVTIRPKVFLLVGATLLLVGVSVKATVEVSLSPGCREFLYMGTAPLGLEDHSLVMICQCYKNKPRYVTLYNTKDHIPVYSAYTFKHSDGEIKVDIPWMYEPQLSPTSNTGEMQQFPPGYMHKNFDEMQAVLEDYTNAVLYERAQLNPDEHQAHPDDKAATYTLTNVVPQVSEFHRGMWKQQEQIIRQRLNKTYYAFNDKEKSQILEVPVPKLEEFLKASGFVNKNFKIFQNDCMSF
ncbi:endonuclease domain-containing 1 protein-like [Trichomycterus rosablanca]|uniref:endonuclease domain-containing 1 protein-like n=1 Tax=Trichomycterus rosablanca TaxID=2290929 RepID=UPI002F356865